MAMFISKFHKLIESRVFWFGIILVMVVTMTLSLVPNVHDWSGFVRGFRVSKAGSINGHEVTETEYRQASQLSNRSPMFGRNYANGAWEWLVIQNKADDLGIAATRADIGKVVYNEVIRQTNGQWDDSLFNYYLSMYAEQNDIPPQQIQLAAELLRQNISLQRTLGVYGTSVLITPAEIQRVFSDFFDSFAVEIAEVARPAVATNAVDVADEQLKAFYEENKETYRTPPQRRALFTRINILQLVDTNRVSETAARAYYDQHLSQYIIKSTNAVDVLSATNSYIAYNDARTGILYKLAYEEAATAARTDAAKLYERFLPQPGRSVPEKFEDVITSLGLQVETSDWVSATSFVPGVEMGRQFTRALFDLNVDSIGEVTEPLVASNHVYMARLLDVREERIPDIREIKDRVTLELQNKIQADAAMEAARKLRDSLQDAVAGGASFSDAAKKAGLEVAAREGIQLSAQPENLTPDAMRAILRSVPGQILEPIPSFSGGHQIIRVMARDPADPGRLTSVEPQIRNSLRQQRSLAAAERYRDQLVKAAKIIKKEGFGESADN